jgi:hypothetical protein
VILEISVPKLVYCFLLHPNVLVGVAINAPFLISLATPLVSEIDTEPQSGYRDCPSGDFPRHLPQLVLVYEIQDCDDDDCASFTGSLIAIATHRKSQL